MDLFTYLMAKNKGGGGGGSDLDWTALGYSKRPQAIEEGYNYAKQIQDNWVPATSLASKFQNDIKLMFMPFVDTSTNTSMNSTFRNCTSLLSIATLDTSNVTLMNSMLSYCSALRDVPVLNTNKVTNFSGMFTSSLCLTDESLNNILQMCINATSYNGTKTLKQLGITNTTYYPISRIQSLSKYQDFINAGWTIGY